MFTTSEDEAGVANLILWADRFEQHLRLVLSAGRKCVISWSRTYGRELRFRREISDRGAMSALRRMSDISRFRERAQKRICRTAGRTISLNLLGRYAPA